MLYTCNNLLGGISRRMDDERAAISNLGIMSGDIYCCIGTSRRSSKESATQISCRLVPSATSTTQTKNENYNDVDSVSSMISTTTSTLEDIIYSHLSPRDDIYNTTKNININGDDGSTDNIEDCNDAVQIYNSEDAHLLHCRPLVTINDNGEDEPTATIFGIFDLNGGSNIPVQLTILEPVISRKESYEEHTMVHLSKEGSSCCCHHPNGDWSRQKESLLNNNKCKSLEDRDVQSSNVNVKIVDLTKLQNTRRRVNTTANSNELYPCFDTPGKVFHLLRSLLNSNGLHTASPWAEMYYKDERGNDDNKKNSNQQQVVAILVNDSREVVCDNTIDCDDQFRYDIEEREVNELLNFRTGDAHPGYYLHSSAQMSGDFISILVKNNNNASTTTTDRSTTTIPSQDASHGTMLLVYRPLPPRDILLNKGRLDDEKYSGCLWETYLESKQENTNESDMLPTINDETPPPVVKHRLVAPPYQSHAHEYPGLFDPLLKSIDILQKEACTIPQWTAWPEQNHYADNCWNVFPLVYCFPANDITQRKFIHKTCSFVPETTKLLHALGPALRTALFSRLDPRAKLGAHTGWSDLANHVLRLHIPLVVPGGKYSNKINSIKDDTVNSYNIGLCGTWVDGCVETHEEGSVISFDDSKVHRAFNYSDEDRIVLIIDLARPQGLPMGTATGGHSDELDEFINSIVD